MPLAERSVLPTLPGLGWIATVSLAVVSTFIGFIIDKLGGSELTGTFAFCYVVGCVIAILVARQDQLFAPIVQPALILFVAVPAAYKIFTGSPINDIKQVALSLGFPLIERFPLMLWTALLVLVIGAIRIFIGRQAAAATEGGGHRSRGDRSRQARPATSAEAPEGGRRSARRQAERRQGERRQGERRAGDRFPRDSAADTTRRIPRDPQRPASPRDALIGDAPLAAPDVRGPVRASERLANSPLERRPTRRSELRPIPRDPNRARYTDGGYPPAPRREWAAPPPASDGARLRRERGREPLAAERDPAPRPPAVN